MSYNYFFEGRHVTYIKPKNQGYNVIWSQRK